MGRGWIDPDALAASLLAEFPGAQFDPGFLDDTAAEVMAGNVPGVLPAERSRVAAALLKLAGRTRN